ncbi:MAG: DNA repair protein RecN [candidate division Zixibacteria bacterium]|nr:DNA repair protein RecN [candidate division Zixibacteria bacterium]
MLRYLSVRNLAVLEEIQVEFNSGLNILTGSTGAGKSIIVGSLGLILGERADSDLIRTGKETAGVEAIFSLDRRNSLSRRLEELEIPFQSGELSVRRELNSKGVSKAFVNDRLVTQATLKQIGAALVDLHGQHQHQSLLDVSRHLDFLDKWADLMGAREELKKSYLNLVSCERQLKSVLEDQNSAREKRDLFLFQLQELESANLKEGEDESLQQEKSMLENVENIASSLNLALAMLQDDSGSALERLATASKELSQAGKWDKIFVELHQHLEESSIGLKEAVRQLESYRDRLEFDPHKLELARERLTALNSLKKKYGASLEGLIQRRNELSELLEDSQSGPGQIEKVEQALSNAKENYRKLCEKLSQKRWAAAKELSTEIEKQLKQLGLEKTRFEIGLGVQPDPESWLEAQGQKVRYGEYGIDSAEFFISPNPGEDLKPLAKIASGGEVSRVMLALKSVLAQKDEIPVLVFDEIDAGIGGEVAETVGRKLKNLARSHQILCITHLQQIASFADSHFKVEKKVNGKETRTIIRPLSRDEKIEEIARMISGLKITPQAHRQASLMLEQAQA